MSSGMVGRLKLKELYREGNHLSSLIIVRS